MKNGNLKNNVIELYVVQNLKLHEVAKKLQLSTKIISKYLKEFKIPIKGIGRYSINPIIMFSPEQHEFFDGLMASDGSLVQQKHSNAVLSCKFKYKQFAEYINQVLGLHCNIKLQKHISDRYKNGFCESYSLVSERNVLFSKERARWYNIKKNLPRDFRFSPISMNILYLGDGCCSNGTITISTNAFDAKNIQDVLVEKLKSVGIDCKINKFNMMVFSKSDSIKFLNFVGECPVKCYEYKWRT